MRTVVNEATNLKPIKPGEFFTQFGTTRPAVKIGLRGEAGSGKSYTAGLWAAGIFSQTKCKHGIVLVDTEEAVKFIKPIFEEAGLRALTPDHPDNQLFLLPNPNLVDLLRTLDWMQQKDTPEILVIDSLTTIFNQYVDHYKTRKQTGKYLTLQDWGFVKKYWADEFSARVLRSNVHVISCGRIGDVYDFVDPSQLKKDDKAEMVKVGKKMKGPKDEAYEFDLYVEMRRHEEIGRVGKSGKALQDRVFRTATVLKSRFAPLDGKTLNLNGSSGGGPSYKDIQPLIDHVLKDVVEVQTADRQRMPHDMFDSPDSPDYQREVKAYQQKINHMLDKLFPHDVKGRLAKMNDALEKVFGSASREDLKALSPKQLAEGLSDLHTMYVKQNPPVHPGPDFFNSPAHAEKRD